MTIMISNTEDMSATVEETSITSTQDISGIGTQYDFFINIPRNP